MRTTHVNNNITSNKWVYLCECNLECGRLQWFSFISAFELHNCSYGHIGWWLCYVAKFLVFVENLICAATVNFIFLGKKKIVMIKSHTTKFTNLLCCCGCPCCSWWTNCVLTIAKALRNIYRQSPWYSWYSLHSYSTIVYDVELMLSPLHQIRGEHKQSNALSSFVLVRIWCCEM